MTQVHKYGMLCGSAGNGRTPPATGQPASSLVFNRIATPHVKNVKMNVLCSDGHISTVDPRKDFFDNPNNQTTAREFLWDAKDNPGGSPPVLSHPGWKRGRTGI